MSNNQIQPTTSQFILYQDDNGTTNRMKSQIATRFRQWATQRWFYLTGKNFDAFFQTMLTTLPLINRKPKFFDNC